MDARKADIDPATIGRRIIEARRIHGLTQAALATRLGISRPALSALEAGRRRLQAEEVYRLAEIFGRPLDYFLGNPLPELEFQPLYRLFTKDAGGRVAEAEIAYGQVTQGSLPLVERFERFCQEWVVLLRMAGETAGLSPEPPVPAPGRPLEPAVLARWVRAQAGCGAESPMPALRRALERNLAVQVFVLDRDGSDLSGASIVDRAAGACVLVTQAHRGHMRFSLAHELAHVLVHRDRPHAQGHDRVRRQEVYANEFAAELLMPEQGILRQAGGRSLDDPVTVQRLAWSFDVSFAAMAVRLEVLKLLPAGWHDGVRAKARAAGEVPGMRPATDTACWERCPERYLFLALRLCVEEKVTLQRLARFLQVDLDKAMWMVEDWRRELGAPREQDAWLPR